MRAPCGQFNGDQVGRPDRLEEAMARMRIVVELTTEEEDG